jgi:AraC-like DNA-binding protein
MAFVYALSRDPSTVSFVRGALSGIHDVAAARTWQRLGEALRERPVSVCVVDLTGISLSGGGRAQLVALRGRFPSVAFVILEGSSVAPRQLLDLGRLGFRSLVHMGSEDQEWRFRRSIERAREQTVSSRVLRAVSRNVPLREGRVLRVALDQVHKCWSAELLAEHVGLSRPFLSVLLKRAGLPAVGRLLVWIRLLHAAEWLGDPGRTGQSVSRQLEYSSGAAFRRVLKNYTGATPTGVVANGGMLFVLRHFLRDTGFDEEHGAQTFVA